MVIDQEFLTKILVNLIRINSTNPSLSSSSPGEAEIGEYLNDVMQSIGLQINTHIVAPGRVNVVGVMKGSGGGKTLMLNAHMDTVGVEGMSDPFSGEIRNGRVYGRGSQDMKGGLAAMVAAAEAIIRSGTSLRGNLILAGVVDEEHASLGTFDLVKYYQADAAIVVEPTDLVIGRAHRGFIWYEVETTGQAAHGSRFLEGIDAIMHMGRFIAALDHLEKDLRQRIPHPLAGPPSLHASTIRGGTEMSIYPAKCLLTIERRTVPGETEEQVTDELEKLIQNLVLDDQSFKASIRPTMWRSPFEIDADVEIIRMVELIISRQLGRSPSHGGASFWTDAAILSDAGIPSFLLGPVGAGLHSSEEWVDLKSTIDLAEILAQTALEFCH